MSWLQSSCGLKFHKNLIVHHEVRKECSNLLSAKPNWNRGLARHFQTSFFESDNHGNFVDRLEKSEPKLVINIIKNANDPFGHIGML